MTVAKQVMRRHVLHILSILRPKEKRIIRVTTVTTSHELESLIHKDGCTLTDMQLESLHLRNCMTLTDMQYVVFHATISSDAPYASQEYFIRHKDGCTLDTEGEKERVIKCIEAAIHRRVSEGVSFELCAKDKVGLLSEVTRILREHGLTVCRAGISTKGEQALNVFYVRDASGNPVDMKTIEAIREEISKTMMVDVKRVPTNPKAPPETKGWAKTSFFFGNLLERFKA